MKVTTGTNYFPDSLAAIFYYQQYNPSLSWRAANDLVNEKIRNKEIKTGKPKIKEGQELKLVDNRWHIYE